MTVPAPISDQPRILIVDDEPANVRLLTQLLRTWGYTDLTSTSDATEVPDLFRTARPDLLLLDLMMPQLDGFAILGIIGPENAGPVRVPVLVLTADVTPEAKRRALGEGATDFVTKPFDFDEVRLRVGNLLETRRLQVELAAEKQQLELRVRARTMDLEHSRMEVLNRLAMASEYHDEHSLGHARRVGATASAIGGVLGLTDAELRDLRLAGPLHDVGKVALPQDLLNKPGRLTPLEMETVKTHTTVGSRLLRGSGSALLDAAEVIARTHHERWDGRGYPNGLAGEEIPLPGRLVAIADSFDVLTHDAPYRVAMDVDAAVEEIARGRGTSYDPHAVDAFRTLDHHRIATAAGAL
jgi:putative two-component system response regulator